MANQSLSGKISFRVFERKELPNFKKLDMRKYASMDAFDQDRNLWNLLSSPLQADRGYFSRKVPITPLTYKHDKNEELQLLGNLEKRPLNEVISDVRKLTDGVCVDNGFIDLKKIDWSQAYQEEEIEEINSIKDGKYTPIETKTSDNSKDNSNLTVKKK